MAETDFGSRVREEDFTRIGRIGRMETDFGFANLLEMLFGSQVREEDFTRIGRIGRMETDFGFANLLEMLFGSRVREEDFTRIGRMDTDSIRKNPSNPSNPCLHPPRGNHIRIGT